MCYIVGMKNIVAILGVVVLLVILSYGSWRVERWAHYKFSYQSQVQKEMKPLLNRIEKLEYRVSVLETNR